MRTRSTTQTANPSSTPTKRSHNGSDYTYFDELKAKRKTRRKPSSITKKATDKRAPKSMKKKNENGLLDFRTKPTDDKLVSSPPSAKKFSEKKFAAWSQHAQSSPYPDFLRPTHDECRVAYNILEGLHGDVIREVFADPDAPAQEYPYVMDALVVAALSQATSWNNAKRAMKNMKGVYGSPFNYEAIVEGGMEKLVDALRPGGMQNKKAKTLMQLLDDVKTRHGKWDLQHLFNATDEELVEEVVSY
ncbi:base excision DNA repair protein [Colletotrichum fioriniae PJ7]|uniref:Base excision DNA repair protein n=1 Tax=Colletotrichum fioriniae PJ7 TaxID=1445577 RepID=A0A010RX48_9PEZI|nr:base excision DNA repair protein [Colletotrichum fioriniae PJ7]